MGLAAVVVLPHVIKLRSCLLQEKNRAEVREVNQKLSKVDACEGGLRHAELQLSNKVSRRLTQRQSSAHSTSVVSSLKVTRQLTLQYVSRLSLLHPS